MSSSTASSITKTHRNIFPSLSSSASRKGNKSGTRSMKVGKSKEAEDANVIELVSLANHNTSSIGKSRSAEYSVGSYADISATRVTAEMQQKQGELDNDKKNGESFLSASSTTMNSNVQSDNNSKGIKPPVSPRKKSSSGMANVDSLSMDHVNKISSTPNKATNELLKKQINGPKSIRK